MTKQPIDILREMRALLAAPERWTQWAVARDRLGNAVNELDLSATSWCLAGAWYRAVGIRDEAAQHLPSWWALQAHAREQRLTIWNDAPGRTHPEVLALLDSCITDLESTS